MKQLELTPRIECPLMEFKGEAVMPEQFSLPCNCGAQVRVEITDAGSDVRCSGCHAPLRVAPLSKLRELAGSIDPYGGAWQRLCCAVENRIQPFADQCQRCSQPASVEVPLSITRIEERHLTSDGGVTAGMLGLQLEVAGGEVVVSTVTIPLLHCRKCQSRFRRWLLWEAIRLWIALPIGIAVAVILFVYAQLWGSIFVIALFFVIARTFGNRRIGRRWETRLKNLAYVDDVLREETDLSFKRHRSYPLKSVTNS